MSVMTVVAETGDRQLNPFGNEVVFLIAQVVPYLLNQRSPMMIHLTTASAHQMEVFIRVPNFPVTAAVSPEM